MREPKYKRVLLKISGEALAGDAHRGLDFAVIGGVCDVIKQCVEAGVQVGVVVGGGNVAIDCARTAVRFGAEKVSMVCLESRETMPAAKDEIAEAEEDHVEICAGWGPQELLQEVLLGLHSLCLGADAPFFNGHTNISGDRFLVFGVGGVLTAAKSLRNALLFSVLAYMSDRLLTGGNTVAVLDELYLWLSNPVAIEYIRNCLKRVRKRDSALVMASQNLEDFDQEGVREMTKPLFAIPPHQFLFNPGSIGKQFYMDMLQLDEAEFELIQRARRGECLYKCGMERYHLEVKAPTHKAALFGSAGGR